MARVKGTHQALPAAEQIEALYLLGPDYQSTFAPIESNSMLQQTPKAAALVIEGKDALRPKLCMSYNAQVGARMTVAGHPPVA